MHIIIGQMARRHITQVIEIEQSAFPTPWPEHFFLQEIASHCGQSFVAVLNQGCWEKVVGYVCAWTVHDECSINKIACSSAYRRMGIGSMLLAHLIHAAYQRGARFFLLEVRMRNVAAQLFYRECDFQPIGIRKRYYSDTGEDAIVMQRHVAHCSAKDDAIKTLTL